MNAEDRVAAAAVPAAKSTRTAGAVVPQNDKLEGQSGGLMNMQVDQSHQVGTADRNTVAFDEATLAAASVAGNSQAFEELYTHYFPKVRALCIRKIGNAHLAEDIAQEAFARAFERISEFGGPRHFGGWVGTIAANLCTDHLRRKKPVASVDQMVEASESNAPLFEFDPIRNVQREDTGRLVRLALAKLDPRQREALVLHEIKGLSCAAVGQHLGISEVAAESLLARARRRLRKEVTAKAIPADLFGLGGLGLLPAVWQGWRRLRMGVGNKVSQVQAAANRGWESVGGNMLPSVDTAKALVVVMGAALATQVASAAAPPTISHDAATAAAASSRHAPVAPLSVDGGSAVEGPTWKVPVSVHADPQGGTAGAVLRGEVQVPDPVGEDGYTGLNVDLNVEGASPTTAADARVWVQDENGNSTVDTGQIGHSVTLE